MTEEPTEPQPERKKRVRVRIEEWWEARNLPRHVKKAEAQE